MKTPTWVDPIVEEVRAIREALARENGYDLDRLAAMVMKSQTRHGKKLVDRSQPKRAPVVTGLVYQSVDESLSTTKRPHR
jgi:hypothetical protein